MPLRGCARCSAEKRAVWSAKRPDIPGTCQELWAIDGLAERLQATSNS